MSGLSPRAGFNWMAVSWGGPNEPVSDTCSYCDAVIPEASAPLILWNRDSWCARFCVACQRTWWGMEIFDDYPDAEDDP